MSPREVQSIRVVDTHTGGEPTRVVSDFPFELPGTTLAEKCQAFGSQFDAYRKAIICEPRGSDVMVGALLTPPEHDGSIGGVIFFNNAGPLLMCGHGMMGFVVTLGHLGLLGEGAHRIETPVGVVTARLEGRNRVTIDDVQ